MSFAMFQSLGVGSQRSKKAVARTGNTTMLLLVGDSNTGFSRMTAPSTDANVKAWKTSTSSLITAQDPLEHISWTALVGPMVFLAKTLSQETGDDIVIVPAGQDGSGLNDTKWKAGGSLYTEAVSRFNDAYAASTNVTKIIIVCSIGINNVGTTDYKQQLDSLVTRLRADLTGASTSTPFILYDPNDDAQYSVGRQGIERIGFDLPNRVAYTATADLTGVRSNDDILGDNDTTHHYDMNIIASRVYGKISEAEANASAVGSQITPQMFVPVTTVDNGDGAINIRVPYSGWYNDQPTSMRIDVYSYDDASFSNPQIVSQNSVTVGTTSYTYTLPVTDGKHYGGEFVGINSSGENRFRTSNTYENG